MSNYEVQLRDTTDLHPAVLRKLGQRAIDAKVTLVQFDGLMDAMWEAVSEGRAIDFKDICTMAIRLLPEPRGRKQRRNVEAHAIALMQRIYALHNCIKDRAEIGDHRLDRWCDYNPDSNIQSTHIALRWAAAYAPLKYSKREDRFWFDPIDLERLAHQGEMIEGAPE